MSMFLQALCGIFIFILIAWLCSERRRAFPVRMTAISLALQFVIAILLLIVPGVSSLLQSLGNGFMILSDAALEGTKFAFGYIGGAEPPFEVKYPQNNFSLMFQVIPVVFITGAVSTLLWHYGILQRIIGALAKVFEKTMGISGSAAFAATADIFFSMSEAITMIRPMIASLSRSDLLIIATTGMTTIASSMFVIYANMLDSHVPNAMVHVLTASFIHVPAGILLAQIIIPPDKAALGLQQPTQLPAEDYHGPLDAFFSGAMKSLAIWLNIMVVLITAIAGIYIIDQILSLLPFIDGKPITLSLLLGWVFAPVALLIGIPPADVMVSGSLIGIKAVVNEFAALAELNRMPEGTISPISGVILSYVLVSFSNPGTAAIMIGVFTAFAPERKKDIVHICTLSMLTGLLATCMTGSVIAILISLGIVV